MIIKEITIGLKRDVRLARYNVSQCHVEMTADLDTDEDPASAYLELYDEVVIGVEEMIIKEKEHFKEELKNAVKNQ